MIFKGLSLKQKNNFFFEGKSTTLKKTQISRDIKLNPTNFIIAVSNKKI